MANDQWRGMVVKEEACYLGVALPLGLVSVAEVIGWACGGHVETTAEVLQEFVAFTARFRRA